MVFPKLSSVPLKCTLINYFNKRWRKRGFVLIDARKWATPLEPDTLSALSPFALHLALSLLPVHSQPCSPHAVSVGLVLSASFAFGFWVMAESWGEGRGEKPEYFSPLCLHQELFSNRGDILAGHSASGQPHHGQSSIVNFGCAPSTCPPVKG